MQVTVRLNTQKEIIWGLPFSKTLLTTQTPEATFETDSLSAAQKQSLYLAIKFGKLLSNTEPDLFFQSAAPAQPAIQQTKPGQTTSDASPVQNTQMPKSPTEIATEAKGILDDSVSEIRKKVLISKDLRLLKMMLALEEGGKKRVTLTKIISDQISHLESQATQASQSVVPGPRPKLIDPAKERVPGKTINYSVEEEAGEKITLVYDTKKEG